jgi:hypothetical protein
VTEIIQPTNNQNLRAEFCTQHEMVVKNTFFNVPLRRRYKWKAPGDSGRYQIDYILVKRRYRNQIKSNHSYPGPDVDSDHNLVIAKCNINFRKLRRIFQPKWCLEKLKDEII